MKLVPTVHPLSKRNGLVAVTEARNSGWKIKVWRELLLATFNVFTFAPLAAPLAPSSSSAELELEWVKGRQK
jgi:hypothetical protein